MSPRAALLRDIAIAVLIAACGFCLSLFLITALGGI